MAWANQVAGIPPPKYSTHAPVGHDDQTHCEAAVMVHPGIVVRTRQTVPLVAGPCRARALPRSCAVQRAVSRGAGVGLHLSRRVARRQPDFPEAATGL